MTLTLNPKLSILTDGIHYPISCLLRCLLSLKRPSVRTHHQSFKNLNIKTWQVYHRAQWPLLKISPWCIRPSPLRLDKAPSKTMGRSNSIRERHHTWIRLRKPTIQIWVQVHMILFSPQRQIHLTNRSGTRLLNVSKQWRSRSMNSLLWIGIESQIEVYRHQARWAASNSQVQIRDGRTRWNPTLTLIKWCNTSSRWHPHQLIQE